MHGTGDDKVHYQNAEAVTNALVTAGKPFTMMAYPTDHTASAEGVTRRGTYMSPDEVLARATPSRSAPPHELPRPELIAGVDVIRPRRTGCEGQRA